MTVVSSKEFIDNQEKYFGLAVDEDIFVEKGEKMFLVTVANNGGRKYLGSDYDEILKPDEDFYRAISMDELCRRVKKDIHQWYRERDESNSIARSTAIS